jgi:enterochelin esterase family protein
MQTTLISPRLTRLQEEIESSGADALESFWREVTERGTPLVEAIDGDDEYRLLTFLWRSDFDVSNVVVLPGPSVDGWDPKKNQMARIAGTHLWHRTYRVRNDLRATYYFSPDEPFLDTTQMTMEELNAYSGQRAKLWRPDPLNPLTFGLIPNMLAESVVELPAAPPQPWAKRRPGVPAGAVEPARFESEMLGNARVIWAYLPPGYDTDGQQYPLVVLFDGPVYFWLRTQVTLDNLLADGRVSPVVCVMIQQLDRNVELPCNEQFADWLAVELLPWVRVRYHVTSDPSRTVIAGSSYGGLAAAFAGLRHPEVFGNVLSQSGSFWWGPGVKPPIDFEDPSIEWEWLIHEFDRTAKLPLRFYLDIGLLEDGPAPGGGPNPVSDNRNMRDVLQAKGYEVHYAEFYGGHQYICWRGTLADGLTVLVGNAR